MGLGALSWKEADSTAKTRRQSTARAPTRRALVHLACLPAAKRAHVN